MEVIIAKTGRLPADTSNSNKLVVFSPPLIPVSESLDYLQPSSTPIYSYNTDTDIQAQEDDHLNHVNTEQALEARGSYIDTEGNTFQFSHVANENGFQPEGAHLSTASLIKKHH